MVPIRNARRPTCVEIQGRTRFVIEAQDRLHRPHPGTVRYRLVAATVAMSLVGGIVLGLPSLGNAQNDGTGAATPLPPTDCLIVIADAKPAGAVTGNPPAASPVASPVAAGSATPIASPVTSDLATPVASPVAADPNAPLLDELYATSEALFACLNERNFEIYAQLTSDAFRGQIFGSDQPLPADQFVILAESLAVADNRIVEITAFEQLDAATVSVEVTYISAYQQRTGLWTFSKETVDGLDAWVLQSETVIPTAVPDGAAAIDVTFEDSGYELDPDAVEGADVILNLVNPTADDHEALVLRLDEGVTTDALLQSTSASLPEGITLVGQSTVLAGGEGTMLLTGLASGTYTIVDLFPNENGIPYLSTGMVTTFTVSD